MSIAREGLPLIGAAAAATALAFAAGWMAIAVLLGICALAIAAFFRDPERIIPTGEGLIVSPADGKVVSIVEVPGDGQFTPGTRVSIFLSPLDVHINRIPVRGKVEEVRYRRGKYLAAYKDRASTANEQNALELVDEQARALRVVQIAGVVARRIVCRVKPGDDVERGERFGLIMFGSRTDLYLPSGCRVEVAEGQRVRGGSTILGRFG